MVSGGGRCLFQRQPQSVAKKRAQPANTPGSPSSQLACVFSGGKPVWKKGRKLERWKNTQERNSSDTLSVSGRRAGNQHGSHPAPRLLPDTPHSSAVLKVLPAFSPLELLEFSECLSSSDFHFPQHKLFSPGSQTTAISLSAGTSAVIFPVV